MIEKILHFIFKMPSGKIPADFIFVQGNEMVSDFYICDHQVTQAEYEEIMGSNPSEYKGDNNPVECVSWYDAVEYCNKLSEKEGLTPCYTIDKDKKDPNNTAWDDDIKWTVTYNSNANGYRLPTDREWEYAARGGNKSKGFKYSGSNNIDEVAWYCYNSEDVTHPVKQKQPNELGIYDMSGNVREWCWDWYDQRRDSDPNYLPTVKDYAGPSSSNGRSNRGGSYDAYDCYCAVDCRSNYGAFAHNPCNGFRLVRSSGK